MKICQVGTEFFHADRRTDRHDKANSRSSQFCERALKIKENYMDGDYSPKWTHEKYIYTFCSQHCCLYCTIPNMFRFFSNHPQGNKVQRNVCKCTSTSDIAIHALLCVQINE